MRINRLALFAVLLAAASGLALAGTATANLSVTADVSANCTISTTALSFGSYDPIVTHKSTDLLGTGTVTTTCTNGASVTVTLDQGSNPAAGSTDDVPLRQMANGSNKLAYFLYSDSGRTTVWGNTSGTGKSDTGTGEASALTIYGKVPKDQNVAAGSYSDTVIATVTF